MAILQTGQRLGAYVIAHLLGRGGMAEVYEGSHDTLERQVAIKVINPAFQEDPTFPLRFRREAKACARLSHPNIITVYDFDERGDIAYLAMELARGGSYQEHARQLTTLSQVVNAISPVCDALGYAHDRGIVHRDIKPDNILITEDARPLLADFGLARIQSESLDVSEVGMILGTPYYMAPEQILAEDVVDQRADIYALGILTYTLIAGEVPYRGDTFTAIAQQHLKAPPPSIAAAVDGIPASLDAAIRRATAKRTADRYATVAEFITALRAAAAEAPDLPVGTAARRPQAVTAAVDSATPDLVRTVATRATAATIDPDATVAGGGFCEQCGTPMRAGLRFCTHCGWEILARPPRPALVAPAQTGAPPPPDEPSPPLPVAARRHRRPSSFSTGQWIALSLAGIFVLFVNIIGLWLAQAGRTAGADRYGSGITTYIFDNLPWFKSAITTVALVLAGIAVFSMRAAVVQTAAYSPATYRMLRQYHRLMGYAAFLAAFAIGLLTCVGIFGFDISTTRRAIHSTLGTILLVLLVVKVGVVRYVPTWRRHLQVIGIAVFVMYALVFASSAVPWVWGQITGEGTSYYSYP